MADDRVSVIFGAQVGELLHGVDQVKSAIEGLRSPIESVAEAFKGIAEAAGIAYAIEKIAELATEMAEVGEHPSIWGWRSAHRPTLSGDEIDQTAIQPHRHQSALCENHDFSDSRAAALDPTATLAARVRGVRYLIRQRTLGP